MADDSDRNSDETTDETENETSIQNVSLSLNAIFELLAHHHRHDILRFLSGTPDNTANIDEVATHLIDRESQRTGKQPGRDQIEMTLHHVHLPKFTDAGIIEYDPHSTELRYWHHDQLEDLLQYTQSIEAE